MSTRLFARARVLSVLVLCFLVLPIDSLHTDAEAGRRRHGPYHAYGVRPAYWAVDGGGTGLRLQVVPRDTEVYLDGYYVGVVDDFDGFFQSLRVPPGEHELVLYLDGREAVRQHLFLNAGATFRVRHEMVPLAPGAVSEPRPEPPDELDDPDDSAFERSEDPERTTGRRIREGERSISHESDRFGLLVLHVFPDETRIVIDGEAWASLPEDVSHQIHLAIGEHRIEIHRSEYASFRTKVTIRPGEETRLNVRLPLERPEEALGRRSDVGLGETQ